MRLFLAMVLLVSGCAEGARAERRGPPKGDPPQLAQNGPPPAWIETADLSKWLAYGSYCWTTLCVDMVPPSMRSDVPTLAVRRGNPVRVHLGFVPRSASILILRGDRTRTLRLRPTRVLEWRPRLTGLVLVDVRGASGSAGYLMRLRVDA